MKKMKSNPARAFILLLLAVNACALPLAEDDPHMAKRLENEAALAEWTAAKETTKTWPGVHADKTARTVTVLAESAGLAADTTIEFALASLVSNHDYESLALMLGKPSHLAEAIEWLGVPRGEPTSRRAARFWPKGEPLSVTVARLSNPDDAKPLGEWITNRHPGGIAFTRVIYTGSLWNDDGECAADGEAPGSVITTFNEPRSLFDIPWRADKGEVYGQYANVEKIEKGELLLFTFKVEPPRVFPLSVLAKPVDEKEPPQNLAQLRFDANGKLEDNPMLGIKMENVQLTLLFEMLADVVEHRDMFVQWTLDDRLAIQAAAQLASAIATIEGGSGIRVDGPPDGQIYYRAFLPNPAWIPREERLTQPFELHVARDEDGNYTRTFVSIDEDWSAPDKITPDLTVENHPVGLDWETALPQIIAEKDFENRKSTLFVFAPPDTPLSVFMPQVRLVQQRLFEVHVFSGEFPE